MRNFDTWLKQMKPSINRYDYYTDFRKVYRKVDEIKIELNILNSLIGSDNIEEEFKALIKKYPETLKAIPILIAKRESEIYCQDENGGISYVFSRDCNSSLTQGDYGKYTYFMKHTGLFDLLQNHIIGNLVDYVTGVETGLDSNGRKNRGGHQMEDLVESYIQKTGAEYYKEMYLSEIERKWGIDLATISANGNTEKRWDFVVKTDSTIFALETNFYSGRGSKLNETARSYRLIAEEAKEIEGFEFVWITDGGGWSYTRRNLKETFDAMEHLYNIAELEEGILNKLFSSNNKEYKIPTGKDDGSLMVAEEQNNLRS